MKTIFKYLKPYWLFVLAIVVMTFLQVQTELSLPDYMSKIVTNGIQYGGITEDYPSAIRESEMNKLLLFSDDDEKILENYDLVEKGTKATIDKMELEFTEPVYLLNENDHSDLTSLIQEALVYVSVSEDFDVNADNVEIVKQNLQEQLRLVQYNYASIVKVYIQSEYQAVGLSVVKIQSNYIINQGLFMLMLSLFGVLTAVISNFFASKVSTKFAADLRRDVFCKIESFSAAEFSRFSSSSLITRTINDVQQVQNFVQMMLRMLLRVPMMGLTSVFKVMRYPSIAWILLIAIVVILAVLLIMMKVALPKFSIIQKVIDKINNVFREILDGILVIRAFNAQDREEKRFDLANREENKLNLFISRLMGSLGPISTLIMNLLMVAIIYFASFQIDINVMSVGDMMAFMQYAMHVVMSFMFFTMTFAIIPRALICVSRIKEVLDTENTILDKDNTIAVPDGAKDLVFDHVSFRYPKAEEDVLHDVSFTISPKETVAIIGSTGSGKSTIIQLIPRLFDVSEGCITYGGIDIRDFKQSELREHIGYVTQKAVLFTGTIASNVSFGRDVADEEIMSAINIAQGNNILDEKEDGLISKVTQGGTNYSGGQKQRLSIARALASKADIYIFDDSFSALDYQTDKKLRASLNELIKEKQSSVIIVAQRIATIKNADKIVVIDGGKICGIGKHQDLLKDCDVYKQIAYSQLSEEELNYAA